MRVAQVNHPHHSRTAFRILSVEEYPARTIPQLLRWEAGSPRQRKFRCVHHVENGNITLQVWLDFF
jgi:hypothetical protein